MPWYKRIETDEGFRELIARLRKGDHVTHVAGLGDGAKALSVVALSKASGRRIAYVSLAGSDLEQLESDIRYFNTLLSDNATDDDVLVLPAIEADPYSGTSPHAEILERRALTLWKLSQGLGSIVLM